MKKNKNLSHPLTISLIGILLGSMLIPAVSSLYSDYRYKIDLKNKIAFNIIENNQKTCSKLNNVFTSIEIFNKKTSFLLDEQIIRTSQIQKNIEISNLYLDFNENSWHWQMGLFQKVKTLNYNERDIDSIDIQLEKYRNNLIERTNLLDQFWDVSLRQKYDSLKVNEYKSSIRDEFNSLEKLNNNLIFELAQYIKEN